MQISTSKALKNGFITTRCNRSLDHNDFKGKSSFDISVREVAYLEGTAVVFTDEYILRPQETVYLISEQRINVKPGYVAYVFLKNRLSQKGIMALNTGIIDGGFNGPISTLITNLSNRDIVINQNKDFFRVVFHAIDMGNDEKEIVDLKQYSYETYKNIVASHLEKLPKHFLDRQTLKKQIDEELSSKAFEIGQKKFMLMLSLVSLLYVALPPLANVVADVLYGDEKKSREQISKLEQKVLKLEATLSSLEKSKENSPSKK